MLLKLLRSMAEFWLKWQKRTECCLQMSTEKILGVTTVGSSFWCWMFDSVHQWKRIDFHISALTCQMPLGTFVEGTGRCFLRNSDFLCSSGDRQMIWKHLEKGICFSCYMLQHLLYFLDYNSSKGLVLIKCNTFFPPDSSKHTLCSPVHLNSERDRKGVQCSYQVQAGCRFEASGSGSHPQFE